MIYHTREQPGADLPPRLGGLSPPPPTTATPMEPPLAPLEILAMTEGQEGLEVEDDGRSPPKTFMLDLPLRTTII